LHRLAHQAARYAIVRLYLAGNGHQELKQVAVEIRERHLDAMHRREPCVPLHALDVIWPAALLVDGAGVARAVAASEAGVFEALAHDLAKTMREPRGAPGAIIAAADPSGGAKHTGGKTSLRGVLDQPRYQPSTADAPALAMLPDQSPLAGSAQIDQIVGIGQHL